MIEKCIGIRRSRQLCRFIRHCNVTFLCLLLTVIVLRGTIGAGKFGTPKQDFIEIRNHFSHRKLSKPQRLLEEVKSSPSSSKSFNYVAFDFSKLYHDDDDDDSNVSMPNESPVVPNVRDWDERREKSSKLKQQQQQQQQQQQRQGVLRKRPRVLLVTGSSSKPCESHIGDHYLLKFIKNKIDYCGLHEIEIYYNMALLNAEMSGFRAKLQLIKTLLLNRPEVEFVWWMDSDAMITDMEFEVPWERYEGFNLVMHGWKEMVFKQKNWVGLNTGSFFIRNCQWSLDFIDAWTRMGPKGKTRVEVGKDRPTFEAEDESMMVYVLANEKEKWGDNVYLENSYYLHGYWGILVDRYEEMLENYHPGLGDHRWPLVTHFVGCKPCGKISDYPVDRCLKQMERAFNFGDNQILSKYGFTHVSLASRRVKRIRDETPKLDGAKNETTKVS